MPSPWARALIDEPRQPRHMTRAELARLYRVTLREGGATWAPGRGQLRPTSGYGMGEESGTFVKVRVGDMRRFARAIRFLLRRRPAAIGTWVEDGVIHIDPALVFNGSEDEALDEARRRGQLAVFSFADGRTIYAS